MQEHETRVAKPPSRNTRHGRAESGTGVVVEERPYGMEPGENAERMEEREEEVVSESDR